MDPNDIVAFLEQVHAAVHRGDALFTHKALDEIDAMAWSEERVFDTLLALAVEDFHQIEQGHIEPVDIYTFCPETDDETLWIRLFIDDGCVVVSFHPAREF